MEKREDKNIDCTIVGDAMFDIVVVGMPQYNPRGTSYCEMISVQPGGSGNVVSGLSKMGGLTAFIGKVGNDALGTVYKQDLTSFKTKTHLAVDEQTATGMCISLVDDEGERNLIVFRGANDTLNPSEIKSFKDTIADSKLLYVCGYSLVEQPQANAIRKSVEIAKNEGANVIFDPGSYNIIRDRKEIVSDIISQSDILVPNYDEGIELAGETSLDNIIESLGKMAPSVFLKTGEQGCVVIEGKEYHKIDVEDVNSVDTTGAGDAFAAAVIYGLTQDFSPKKVGFLANWFASRNVQLAGPRALPNKKEIDDVLRRIR